VIQDIGHIERAQNIKTRAPPDCISGIDDLMYQQILIFAIISHLIYQEI
jgi:hypothetical protein